MDVDIVTLCSCLVREEAFWVIVVACLRLSVADCDYRESWGWNRDSVWVDKGCRAEFEVTTR